jgi:hypothetical protein
MRTENPHMAIGRKTGGRTAGTPNRRTADVVARLKILGCDPIEGMARLAMDLENAPELRGRMFSELAQYVAPKRRALDVAAADAAPVMIRIGIPGKASTTQAPVQTTSE